MLEILSEVTGDTMSPLPPASNRTLFRECQGSERAQHAVSRRGLLSGQQHVPSHRRSLGEAIADALPLYERPSDGSAAAERLPRFVDAEGEHTGHAPWLAEAFGAIGELLSKTPLAVLVPPCAFVLGKLHAAALAAGARLGRLARLGRRGRARSHDAAGAGAEDESISAKTSSAFVDLVLGTPRAQVRGLLVRSLDDPADDVLALWLPLGRRPALCANARGSNWPTHAAATPARG